MPMGKSMNNGTGLLLLCCALAIVPGLSNADIYKCVVNGKTTYSEIPCAPQAKKIRPDIKADGIPNYSTTSAQDQYRDSSANSSGDPRCAELLEQLKNTPLDTSEFFNVWRSKAARKTITEEYELRCRRR